MSDGSAISQRDLEIQNAKAQLLQSKDGEPCTYDILTKVIRKILDERPANAAGHLSQIIDRVQKETCPVGDGEMALQSQHEASSEFHLAETQKTLFEQGAGGENEAAEDDEDAVGTPLPDMQELLYFFEQGGVGLGREEWMRVYFALKQLCDRIPLASCRFWGKILGTQKNYYIAEVQFRDEEDVEEGGEDDEEEDAENGGDDDEEAEDEENKLPKSNFKLPPKVPTEPSATPGSNKYSYFICNEPGEEWQRLPNISPQQIQVSRQITKFFTGDLSAPVVSFPNYPGNEGQLLRAQIARISAGTVIAPMTYYQFDEDEEVEEEEMAQTEFIENPDFEGVPVRDLSDPSLQGWVHTRLHILLQGRCIWWNPKEKGDADEEFDEDEEENDADDQNEPEQELGPPLLTPLSDDMEVGGLPPWSAHLSSGLAHIQHSICLVKSNLWPGAVAFSNGKKFENIYIGWGVKYHSDNFSPQQPDAFQGEYTGAPEIVEVSDPTVEEETALKQQNDADQGEDEENDEDDED